MTAKTSIKTRLTQGLMLIVIFFLVQAGSVWYVIDHAKNSVVETTRHNTMASAELGSLAVLAQQVRRYEKEYFVYVDNKEKRDSYEGEWRDAIGKIEKILGQMKTGSDGAFSPNDIEEVAKWSDASAFYSGEMQKIFRAVNERAAGKEAGGASNSATETPAEAVPYLGLWQAPASASHGSAASAKVAAVRQSETSASAMFRPSEVNDMIKAGKERFSGELIKGVETMSKAKTADTLALADTEGTIFNSLLIGVLASVAVGVLVAVLLSLNLPKMVQKTIDRLSTSAHEMSMGNLQQEYDAGGVVEFDQLVEALNRMRLGQLALIERLQKRR